MVRPFGRVSISDAVAFAEARRSELTLVLRVTSPVRAEKPMRRTSVAELILRTGFGLPVGGVDLDFDTGAVSFRAGVDLATDGALTETRLARLLAGAVTVLDWLHPALVAVAEGGELPEHALERLGPEVPRG